MKPRNTILMLVVCFGLFGYIKFFHSKELTTEEEMVRRNRPVQINRDKVNAITLRNGEGTFELVKRDGNWFLKAPVKDRVESATVAGLFTSAEGLVWSPVQGVENEKESLKQFGLEKGDVSIILSGEKGMDEYHENATSVEILAGKDSAIEGRVYFRLASAKAAYLGSRDLRDSAAKGIKDWRSRSLSDITASQVTKLVLKTEKGEMELEKQGLNWSFTKPFKARGDNQAITDMIASTLTARIGDFITDSKDLGAFGLTEPRATLTIFAEGESEPVVLQVGAEKALKVEEPKAEADAKKDEPEKPKSPTHVYVKLSTRDGVVTVPVAMEALIAKQPNDLRDQSLMCVQSDIVDRITIEAPGKEKIVLGRSGEAWVRKIDGKEDQLVNVSAANQLLNTLVNAKVSRLVADMASDLKGFGLDKPTTVTLSSYSTEGTPETNPGDKPIVKLLLGRFEGGAGYAKLDDEPFIVAVDHLILQDVLTDPVEWQDLKIFDLKKDDVATLEVKRVGQPALTFNRDKDKAWKLAKGDGTVSQNAMGSLLNTISSLRAVRWVGPTDKAAHGIAKPNLTVAFVTAEKKTGRLTIGTNTEDEMWHAVIDGKPGTFLLNKLDFDALNSALIEGANPAAALPAGNLGEPKPTAVAKPAVPLPVEANPPAAAPAVPAEPATPPPATPVPPAGGTPEPAKPTEAPSGSATPAPAPMPKAE